MMPSGCICSWKPWLQESLVTMPFSWGSERSRIDRSINCVYSISLPCDHMYQIQQSPRSRKYQRRRSCLFFLSQGLQGPISILDPCTLWRSLHTNQKIIDRWNVRTGGAGALLGYGSCFNENISYHRHAATTLCCSTTQSYSHVMFVLACNMIHSWATATRRVMNDEGPASVMRENGVGWKWWW